MNALIRELTYAQAIQEALATAMEADEAVRSIKIPEATMRNFLESAQNGQVD